MNIILKHKTVYIVTLIAVTMFFSCDNRLSDVQKMGISENEPIGVAENLNLKQIDSGRVEAILISPKMLDYSNRAFAFNEFPEGINLELFEKGKKTATIIADYAMIYNKTNLIDLQGHVILATDTKDTLFAEQLFFDQSKQWVFTNRPVTFRTGLDKINGNGFDSDAKFEKAEVLEINGIITLDE
ncbi:LPS export ABC transporter periplasmic protein LptC [Mariniflexile ostreae]|uniref:LPS export ABC transporter periplasmic protein LptC n=1 Tax=Mariniflexile ostreae TaxID=1520892 RepID=A0ABV5FC21_9FLAO